MGTNTITDISNAISISSACTINYKRAYIQNGRVFIYIRLSDLSLPEGENAIGSITGYNPKGTAFGGGAIQNTSGTYSSAQLEIGSGGTIYVQSDKICNGKAFLSISYLPASNTEAIDISDRITFNNGIGTLSYKRAYKHDNRIDIYLCFSTLNADNGEVHMGNITNCIPEFVAFGGGVFKSNISLVNYRSAILEVGSTGKLYTVSDSACSGKAYLSISYLLKE